MSLADEVGHVGEAPSQPLATPLPGEDFNAADLSGEQYWLGEIITLRTRGRCAVIFQTALPSLLVVANSRGCGALVQFRSVANRDGPVPARDEGRKMAPAVASWVSHGGHFHCSIESQDNGAIDGKTRTSKCGTARPGNQAILGERQDLEFFSQLTAVAAANSCLCPFV